MAPAQDMSEFMLHFKHPSHPVWSIRLGSTATAKLRLNVPAGCVPQVSRAGVAMRVDREDGEYIAYVPGAADQKPFECLVRLMQNAFVVGTSTLLVEPSDELSARPVRTDPIHKDDELSDG